MDPPSAVTVPAGLIRTATGMERSPNLDVPTNGTSSKPPVAPTIRTVLLPPAHDDASRPASRALVGVHVVV